MIEFALETLAERPCRLARTLEYVLYKVAVYEPRLGGQIDVLYVLWIHKQYGWALHAIEQSLPFGMNGIRRVEWPCRCYSARIAVPRSEIYGDQTTGRGPHVAERAPH